MKNVTTVIINYQTPELLKIAVESFKRFYPDAHLLIVDNGSNDEKKSENLILGLKNQYSNIEAQFLAQNIYHGPAMDLAVKNFVTKPYVFFLDSDTDSKKNGFLESMVELLQEDDKNYGVGEIIRVNKSGYKSEVGSEVLLTPYMLLRTDIYKSLEPFIHHGQPTFLNFRDAHDKEYNLVRFPISEYIDHLWRGTANKFGYGLGLKGKIDYVLNKLGL